MDSSMFEQFLGPISTQFQLPATVEEESDEVHPLINIAFYRLNKSRKVLIGINNHRLSKQFVLFYPRNERDFLSLVCKRDAFRMLSSTAQTGTGPISAQFGQQHLVGARTTKRRCSCSTFGCRALVRR